MMAYLNKNFFSTDCANEFIFELYFLSAFLYLSLRRALDTMYY
jgi:hypothetical protein